jgi:hypothetical protein
MSELKPCMCGDLPALHRPSKSKEGAKHYAYECVSAKCADRIVKTHQFATEESARAAWNGGRD